MIKLIKAIFNHFIMRRFLSFYVRHFDRWIYKHVIMPFWIFFIFYIFLNLFLNLPIIKEAIACWYTYFSPGFTTPLFWKPLLKPQEIAIMSTFLAAILGIAIPLSLNIVYNLDQKYNRAGIVKEFVKEPLNKIQLFFLLTNVFIIVISLFFIQFNALFSILYILYFLITVISFAAYINLIREYSTDVKNILANRLYQELMEYFNENNE